MKHSLMALFVMIGMTQAYAETITISGSTTVKKYIELAAEAYSTTHPNVSFDIKGGGSTSGFGEVISRRVHIGVMSRGLTPKESNVMGDFQHIVIAYDAVIPIISDELYHSGSLKNISVDQLAKIYRGEITNWKAVGGPDRPILLVDKEIHHGTRYVFARYVLGDPLASASPGAITLEGNQDVYNIIAASDQAIAYISASYIDEVVHPLAVEIKGQVIMPNTANIRDGTYPLSRKLYMILPDCSPPYIEKFVQFILSRKGQEIVAKAGYLALPFTHKSHHKPFPNGSDQGTVRR